MCTTVIAIYKVRLTKSDKEAEETVNNGVHNSLHIGVHNIRFVDC